MQGHKTSAYLRFWALVCLFLMAAPAAWAQQQTAMEAQEVSAERERGFKVGKLRLHPGLSLQNVFDSNVSNASDRYDNADYLARYFPSGRGNNGPQSNYDDVLHIVGAFKLDYPDDTVAVTLDTQLGYVRYFGIDNSDTSNLSSLSASGRLTADFFRASVVGFTLSDTFTRSTDVQQVGLAVTNDRIHNRGQARLNIRPGGGQLRFFVGYINDLEIYDDDAQANQNWLEHTFNADWELEFLPETAVFMRNSFSMRDYYDFDANRDEDTTNSDSPDAMSLRITAGIYGRIASFFLLNLAVGYGRSFSDNFDDFNSAVAKVEAIFQLVSRTQFKAGYERSFSPVTTFSYLNEDKLYLEFRQWLFSDAFKLYLYGAYSFLNYGGTDAGVDVDDNAANVYSLVDFQADAGLGKRSDRMLSTTASLRYDFLVWLWMELGYKFTWRDTDYFIERINSEFDRNTDPNQFYVSATYYDFIKHEGFLKLTFAY